MIFRRLHRPADKAAFTLVEIIVSLVILVLLVTGFISVNLGYRYNIGRLQYYFVAVNLAREIEEYFESIKIRQDWKLVYYYANSGPCYSGPGPEVHRCSGYALRQAEIPPAIRRETRDRTTITVRDRPDATPFDVLGDIKQRGLVPKGAPDSVIITCTATYDPGYGSYIVSTTIVWRDLTIWGQTQEYNETLSIIPLTPINNQITIDIGELKWD